MSATVRFLGPTVRCGITHHDRSTGSFAPTAASTEGGFSASAGPSTPTVDWLSVGARPPRKGLEVRSFVASLNSTLVYAIVIHMPNRTEDSRDSSSTSVLSVRVSSEERALLKAASDQARTSLSDFVRRKAVEAAEVDVLERTVITIPAKDWDDFEAWVRRPAKSVAALRKLARKAQTWQR